jgi:CheY-like chemotaxis protein
VQGTAVVAPEVDRERVPLHGRRVLLVEDDEATRTLLATILRSFGAEVRAASCVADALAHARVFAAEILISDIEMPGDDGISLLHELRERSGALPAIAVTGYADARSRERILAAGFDGFVAKPLDPHALATEVRRALAGRERHPSISGVTDENEPPHPDAAGEKRAGEHRLLPEARVQRRKDE